MMVPFREDTAIYPLMIALSACLCDEIVASGLPEPCQCGPIVGDLVLDYCGTCVDGKCGGQAWVRLTNAFPSTEIPTPLSNSRNCGVPLAFTVEVGIARCKPVGKASGVRGFVPPSLDQQVGALRLQTADMAAMYRAINCCFGQNDNVDYVVGVYQPASPDGDCLGGAFQVTISGSL